MLEIGTGTGIGTSWLLDGLNAEAQLTTVDINPEIQAIAQSIYN
jgi:predicted O-methyltransferase YrrM